MEKLLSNITSNKDNLLTGNLIHSLDKQIITLHNENLKKLDITLNQALILFHIEKARELNQEIFQKDIEIALGLTNPTVTSAIKTMMTKNLLYRVQKEEDKRYFSLHLTEKSEKIVKEALHIIIETDASFTSNLSKEEKEQLAFLLKKITHE